MQLQVFQSSLKSWQSFKYFQSNFTLTKKFFWILFSYTHLSRAIESHLNLCILFKLILTVLSELCPIKFSCMLILSKFALFCIWWFLNKFNLLKIALLYLHILLYYLILCSLFVHAFMFVSRTRISSIGKTLVVLLIILPYLE